MKFYSTTGRSPIVSLKRAVFNGIAPDGGLYLPVNFPNISPTKLKQLSHLNSQDLYAELALTFFEEDFSEKIIQSITKEAFNYPITLVPLESDCYGLELFHGPTLSFKDFGARFMAQLVKQLLLPQEKLLVLVSTSGDTGSAVAQAFYEMPNVNVAILYSKGQVSDIQEKQLTALGKNIIAIEVAGTFDDCQNLVKKALKDEVLKSNYILTTANSINVARLIPQTFYYFYAYAQLPQKNRPIIISVPCGNYGHLISGLIAKKMGLPISHFVAATNINDEVPKFLETGLFQPKPSIRTISNSMDVGNPSNFPRFLDFFNKDLTQMHNQVVGLSFADRQTQTAIKQVYESEGYILDPHGAISYLGLKSYLNQFSAEAMGIFLATAHPAKFTHVVEPQINKKIKIPEQLERLLKLPKHSVSISNQYKELHHVLMSIE